MKRTSLLLMMMTLVLLPATGAESYSVDELSFLTGHWTGKMFRGVYTARYTAPGGGVLLSYSELQREGETASFEFERFHVKDGKLIFTPYADGRPGTSLFLTTLDKVERKATFENPDKDFPTRIVYHRIADGRLVITLSDPHNDSDRELVFDLKGTD